LPSFWEEMIITRPNWPITRSPVAPIVCVSSDLEDPLAWVGTELEKMGNIAMIGCSRLQSTCGEVVSTKHPLCSRYKYNLPSLSPA
jgi:hypothetical protein